MPIFKLNDYESIEVELAKGTKFINHPYKDELGFDKHFEFHFINEISKNLYTPEVNCFTNNQKISLRIKELYLFYGIEHCIINFFKPDNVVDLLAVAWDYGSLPLQVFPSQNLGFNHLVPGMKNSRFLQQPVELFNVLNLFGGLNVLLIIIENYTGYIEDISQLLEDIDLKGEIRGFTNSPRLESLVKIKSSIYKFKTLLREYLAQRNKEAFFLFEGTLNISAIKQVENIVFSKAGLSRLILEIDIS